MVDKENNPIQGSHDPGSDPEATPGRGWLKRPHDDGSFTDAYRRLAMQLHFDLGSAGQPCCLMLTSPGRTREVCHATLELAEFFAREQKKRVLIVDGCYRQGGLCELFEIEADHGLLNLLNGAPAPLESLLHATGHPNVSFLPPGRRGEGLTRYLVPERLQAELRRLKEQFDCVLISCPSVLDDPAALAFPSAVDCVLVLVQPGVTRWQDLEECRRVLDRCKARRVGLVLTVR